MVDDKTKLDQGTDPAVADSGATSDERPAIICAGAGCDPAGEEFRADRCLLD